MRRTLNARLQGRREPRAYLHLVTAALVRGWPNSKLRDLLPDHMLAAHHELHVGERSSLPTSEPAALLA